MIDDLKKLKLQFEGGNEDTIAEENTSRNLVKINNYVNSTMMNT